MTARPSAILRRIAPVPTCCLVILVSRATSFGQPADELLDEIAGERQKMDRAGAAPAERLERLEHIPGAKNPGIR